MKSWILRFCLVALSLAAPRLRADDSDLHPSAPAVRKEVIAAIDGQLAAFRAHDPDRAYGFASAPLRAQFPADQFAAVVRRGYPEIWANVRAEYGIVNDSGTRAAVNVRVYGPDGSAAYDYELVREPAGWRIGGVLRRAPKPADNL
jgi:hypothetical protein